MLLSPHCEGKERDRFVPSNAFDRLDAKSNDVEKRGLAEIGERE